MMTLLQLCFYSIKYVINKQRDGKDLEEDFVAQNVYSKERRKLW
jgi:hypothetical protein